MRTHKRRFVRVVGFVLLGCVFLLRVLSSHKQM